MIELQRDGVNVPAIALAAPDTLPANSVYVQLEENGQFVTQLPDGEKAVLEQAGASAELKTRAAMKGNPGGESATIVNPEDYRGFVLVDGQVTIRAYRFWHDGLRKIGSVAGLRLLATTLIAALTFAGGAWFLLRGDEGTDAATVSGRAQTLLEWAQEPAADLGSASDPAAVRRQLEQRRLAASNCLRQLKGEKVPAPDVAGVVECKPSDPAWYRDKDNEALLTMILGGVTLLLTGWASLGKFSFGKDPAEA
jgi:hypothetical protein